MSTCGQEWADPKHIERRVFRTDITPEEAQTEYKEWVLTGLYDQILADDSKTYSSLTNMASALKECFPVPGAELILDVGAGTGNTGSMLRKLGFTNLHALEPQLESLEIARGKQLYSQTFNEFIGGDNPVSAPADTYDVIVSTGTFAPGHIPCSALPEMIRLVKPGGYVIICMRKEFLHTAPEYKDKLEPLMEKLQEEGKWRQLKRDTYPHHFVEKDGLLFLFQIC